MQTIRDPDLTTEATCASCGTTFTFYPREAKGRYCGAPACLAEQRREAGRARAVRMRMDAALARPLDRCFVCGGTFRPKVHGGGRVAITCTPECGRAFRSWAARLARRAAER